MTSADSIRSGLRLALAATSACLGLGLLMSLVLSGPLAEVATALIWVGLALLMSVPVLNVVSVLLDEWPKRPRTFALAAIGVLLLLAWTIVTRSWATMSRIWT